MRDIFGLRRLKVWRLERGLEAKRAELRSAEAALASDGGVEAWRRQQRLWLELKELERDRERCV